MAAASARLQIKGLTELDKADLERQLATAPVNFEEAQTATGAHGELATFIAIIAVSHAALAAFSIWVCRRSRAEEYEQEYELVHPDGRIERKKIRIVRNSSDPPEAGVIKQIAAAFQIDETKILEALRRDGQ